ncbi:MULTISPECIES: IclR family transcriptional regulator [Rhodobacterales]|uniref:IclR family transcriptional regulator n=1 Tax=Roseobacter sp. N2S TaxID=2663844 RepID=UPI00285459F4|nr:MULTISPECIES: IclR family transcriptional regulator [Rhodobacterales]MDR6264088.1 DNA-binding IclR family transcriptional regulator [Roseobacter sp. N2S]
MPKSSQSEPASRGVQSIETGGRILRELANAYGPIKLRDLAALLNVAPAQLHPYLVSFRAMEMVEQTARGTYQLGPFALQLGLARLRGQNAYRDTIARVGDLSDALGLMISVSVWGAQGPTITYVQEYAARIHANVQVGGIYNMTVTATGRVFAAFLPPSMTKPVIERELTDHEFRRRALFDIDEAAYNRAVAETKKLGYSITRDMPIPGVSAVAAPVFDHTGAMQLCVTAIGPTGLIDLDPKGEATTGLLEFTEKLSRDFGHEHASAPSDPVSLTRQVNPVLQQ